MKMYRTEVMTSIVTSQLTFFKNYSFQNVTFYIPLESKLDASQFLTKDLGLEIYGTEGMTSKSGIIVSIFRKLFPLKHQFERKFNYNDFLAKDLG